MGLPPARFDVHQHVGRLIGIAGEAEPAVSAEQDARRRIAFMDRFDIARAALMPAHSYPQPNGAADTRALNDDLHAYAALAPDRFVAVVGTVEPRHGLAAVDETRRVAGMGFKGLSWHHRMQGLPMDHPVMFAIVEEMAACGLSALAHCYAHGDFEAPWRLRRLAESFPATRFAALDVMTSPENLEQLLAIIDVLDNVWLDLTSTSLGAEGIALAVRRVGAGRILFGTNYYGGPVPDQLVELRALEEAGLGDPALEQILRTNGAALLG